MSNTPGKCNINSNAVEKKWASRGYEGYRNSLTPMTKIEYGDPSGDDLSSDYSSEKEDEKSINKPSQWKKVRNMVHWSPFVQTYKKQKYPWVQLAGHQGNFQPGEAGTIKKKLCGQEDIVLKQLMMDPMQSIVPKYIKLLDVNGEKFVQMEDLLATFDSPSVMDVKIGVRTYLEDELEKARQSPKFRKDMYDKMVQIDKNEPTEEENRLKAVTKPRYMIWRETISSTSTLGFRIEGVKYPDGSMTRDFKTVKTLDQIKAAISQFTANDPNRMGMYLERLKEIDFCLNSSTFFKDHELIGVSLLFVHDKNNSNIWLIDFAKTFLIPNDINDIKHDVEWEIGSHEDGFLVGIRNLISIFKCLSTSLKKKTTIDD